jgi:leukotriene-A4 hydrolase
VFSTAQILDCVGLVVSEVSSRESGESLAYQVKQLDGELTPCLDISLPSTCAKKDAELGVRISYKTDPALCAAVQWLEPSQTMGKKHPYLYTQCQAIHARSMLPCQDTPSVKSTFSAKVAVACELVALMGAERLGSGPHSSNPALTVFSFRQNVPIPTYLAALVVGALESKRIGPRSHVWCEKEMVEKAAWEFEETEKMLSAAEEVVGEYQWGQYDILVLPPSFAYGGMENPCLTFLSPSLLAGDRSLANVIAHELSHSWTGNLVTNENWEEFWMNEGFTTFLERRIAAKVFNEKERHLQASVGWNQMEDAIRSFEKQGKAHYTPLVPELKGLHPDDVFSCIPYEKGSSFLFYLETLIGGPGTLDGFLKAHIAKFRYRTVTTEQWKQFLLEYFHKEVSNGVLEEVEWEKWIREPGMPPLKPLFDTTLADASIALAEKWAAVQDISSTSQFSSDDITNMSSLALQYFLDVLKTKVLYENASIKFVNCTDTEFNVFFHGCSLLSQSKCWRPWKKRTPSTELKMLKSSTGGCGCV